MSRRISYLHLSAGQSAEATEDSPYLQIGETKYGRPILDRGIVYDKTPLEVAALYAMLSFDATIRSNVTVGPPLDLWSIAWGHSTFTEYRRFPADDPRTARTACPVGNSSEAYCRRFASFALQRSPCACATGTHGNGSATLRQA